jgi:transcription elongation factor Elf1
MTDWRTDGLNRAQRRIEIEAVRRLEKARWPDGFICPRCGLKKGKRLKREVRWLCMCSGCRKQTSVTSGTSLHRSRVWPSRWVAAVEKLASQVAMLTGPLLRERLQKSRIFDIRPWTLQKELPLGNLNTAKTVLRILEEALRRMPVDTFGGQQRATTDDILQALLRPQSDVLTQPRRRVKISRGSVRAGDGTSPDEVQHGHD